jgi:hypothetical protein
LSILNSPIFGIEDDGIEELMKIAAAQAMAGN